MKMTACPVCKEASSTFPIHYFAQRNPNIKAVTADTLITVCFNKKKQTLVLKAFV